MSKKSKQKKEKDVVTKMFKKGRVRAPDKSGIGLCINRIFDIYANK